MPPSARAAWRPFPVFWLFALAAALAHAQSPRVVLGGVERGPMVEEIPLNGTIVALRRAELSVSVEGLVTDLTVDTGERVLAGATLLKLDDELAVLEGKRAQAETREAERRLAEARRVLQEARSTRGGRVIAATEVERRASDVAVAEAVLARTRATEQFQAARIARHTLSAPFAGVVAARHVDIGEWVAPGTAAFALIDTDALRIDFQVPQRAAVLLDKDSTLALESRDGTSRTLEIATWLPVTDERARTFLLRAKPPAGSQLSPGMAVKATLRLLRAAESLSIPRDALTRHPDGRVTVWVAETAPDSGAVTVREQRIDLAGTSGDRAYVADGLSGDERIVVRGNEGLRPGSRVRTGED